MIIELGLDETMKSKCIIDNHSSEKSEAGRKANSDTQNPPDVSSRCLPRENTVDIEEPPGKSPVGLGLRLIKYAHITLNLL